MLMEAWQWWRTACLPEARKMGHLSEAIALEARAHRQKTAWDVHLAHARASILKLANTVRTPEGVIVFGSGSLYDVPIEALAEKFTDVYLVDIVHTKCAREKAGLFQNVHFIECDITFLVADVLRLSGESDEETFIQVTQHKASPPTWPKNISFVVSANCLSQLSVKPVDWLQSHCPKLSDEALNTFAWALMREHIQLLRSFGCPVCLVTDDIQMTNDKAGRLIEKTEYVEHLQLSDHVFARWPWHIAPQGELEHGMSALHEVVAIRL